jgi:hypothetical protein
MIADNIVMSEMACVEKTENRYKAGDERRLFASLVSKHGMRD